MHNPIGDREPQVRTCALPIFLQRSGAKSAVLGIHGYAGYPGELSLPAARLYEAGYTVFVPRLPGPGTHGDDFTRTSWRDWLRKVLDSYEDLAAAFDTVHIFGHSMGGLLALILAGTYPTGRIALMAPALRVSTRSLQWIPYVYALSWKKRIPIPWVPDPRYEFFDVRDPDDDAFLGKEYWSWMFIQKLRDLYQLQRMGRRALAQVKVPTLVITGGHDIAVPRSVGAMVEERCAGQVKWLHLPMATHLIPYDIDAGERERAMEELVGWFEQ